MACPPPVRSAQQPTVPPLPTTTAPTHPTQLPAVDAVVDGHRLWLDGLSLHDRLRYDRAFGHAWFAGNNKEQCQVAARKAVEGSRHVGAGSTIAPKAEQVRDHAPGALASSRPSALLLVPALFALFACLGVPASSVCPNTSASLAVPASAPVPALFACPDTSACLDTSVSLARPSVPASAPVPALSASSRVPASSRHVGAGRGISRYARTEARAWPLGDIGAKKGPRGASTDPTTGNAATDRAGRDTGNHTIPNGGRANNPCEGMNQGVAHPTRHVGPRSNISREAEQPSEHTPAGHQSRNVKPGKVGKMRNGDVNGSFPTTYAEDRDGNSRASSFCLLRPRTRRQVPQK
jgi:hypothetical protein